MYGEIIENSLAHDAIVIYNKLNFTDSPLMTKAIAISLNRYSEILGMGKFMCVIDWKTHHVKLDCYPRKRLVGRIYDIKEAMDIAMRYYETMMKKCGNTVYAGRCIKPEVIVLKNELGDIIDENGEIIKTLEEIEKDAAKP